MKFYKKFIRTFNDLPDHTTLLIHSLVGCPLKCVGCHNYDEIIANTPKDYYTSEDVIGHIEQNGYLFDAVMFSGGEFLMENVEDVSSLLKRVRQIFDGKIIVCTNGMYDEKVKVLLHDNLVDGIHIDMKLPYHSLDVKEDKDIYQAVMGISPTTKFVNNMLRSIEMIIEHGSVYSQVRSVKYPILSQEFFDETRCYIEELQRNHNSKVPYFQNEFFEL